MRPKATSLGIAELLRRARGGDRWAEEALFGQLHARILGVAKRRIWDEEAAADLAQETLRTICEKYRQVAMPQGFMPWVFAILRNKTGNYLKRRRTERAHLAGHQDIGAAASSALPPDGALSAIELANALGAAMQAMSRECRQIFRLLLSGAGREQIAAAFAGTPMGTIDSRISRCRRRLLARLEQDRARRRRP